MLLIHFSAPDTVNCDELPNHKIGNVTKWGCSVSRRQSDCSSNGTWSSHCCIWNNEKCASKNKGFNNAFISTLKII